MRTTLKAEYHVPESPNIMSRQWSGVLLETSSCTEPRVVAICDCLNEAKEMGEADFARLIPDEDPCPEAYEYHARTADGSFRKVATFWL